MEEMPRMGFCVEIDWDKVPFFWNLNEDGEYQCMKTGKLLKDLTEEIEAED